VQKALKQLGWGQVRQTGSHIIYRHPNISNIIVLPNHNPIKKGTLKSIIDDLNMTIEEFFDLV
jgi:predicted RNA binding protein YcfA (HicA-like mRNA interferase family)